MIYNHAAHTAGSVFKQLMTTNTDQCSNAVKLYSTLVVYCVNSAYISLFFNGILI